MFFMMHLDQVEERVAFTLCIVLHTCLKICDKVSSFRFEGFYHFCLTFRLLERL